MLIVPLFIPFSLSTRGPFFQSIVDFVSFSRRPRFPSTLAAYIIFFFLPASTVFNSLF